MSDNSNDLGAFLAGFVIGGLVGAATAIILAPQSGEETRSQIMAKSDEMLQAGSHQFQQARDAAGSYGQEYAGRANDLLSGTRQQLDNTRGRMQEQARIVLDKGREQASKLTPQANADDNNHAPADEDGEE